MQAHSLNHIQDMIAKACRISHRQPSEISLIGASKSQSIESIHKLACAGLHEFGENYVQELLEKIRALSTMDEALASRIRWHFIGTLQRRKVRQIIDKVAWIHSLDRLSIAQEIDHRASECGKTAQALIQINLSGEASKGGIRPEEAKDFLKTCCHYDHLQIHGFMTLPPYFEDPEQVRPYFGQLKNLRDEINQRAVYKEALTELSMGMSHDFQVAIEEGATMVRIGTLLFGERE